MTLSSNSTILRVLLASVLFSILLFAVVPVPAQAAGIVPCGGYEEDGNPEPPCNFDQLMVMANRITHFILFILALPIAALMIAYAGFLYLTGGANPQTRSKARGVLIKVVMGLILAFAAWLIVNSIMGIFGVDDEAIFLGGYSASAVLLV